ncbi:MAG: hypothetical protein EBZ48_17520 [Proteobacteria bacterium]|nr:hypothetical protein [Pseudomonadota bacterium]
MVRPVQRLKANAASWISQPENRNRVGFALLSTGLDGTLNTGAMVLLQGTPLPSAMAVGAAIAVISGAWTFASPEVARFLSGEPSLVDRILNAKHAIARQGGKMLEGLLKWGIIEFAAMSIISGVSVAVGVSPWLSFSSWVLSNASSSILATFASGTFDFSLGYELDQAMGNPALSDEQKKRILRKTQIIGITAGTLGTLGGVAQVMGQSFGSVLLYGLTAVGVGNLARVEWKEIQRLLKASSRRCGAYLVSRRNLYGESSEPNRDYPNHGSE